MITRRQSIVLSRHRDAKASRSRRISPWRAIQWSPRRSLSRASSAVIGSWQLVMPEAA